MAEGVKPIDILLVDDNENDILITRRAFKKVGHMNGLHGVYSGQESLAFIYHQGPYAETKPPTPGLILLDIYMFGMDGFEVLKKLKSDPKKKRIPVVMFTTSSRKKDIIRSYENGAASYIIKPTDFDDFVKTIEKFKIYWTLVSNLP